MQRSAVQSSLIFVMLSLILALDLMTLVWKDFVKALSQSFLRVIQFQRCHGVWDKLMVYSKEFSIHT